MYYKIFSNCQIVDGASKSLIYDLQKENTIGIPKELSKVLKKYDGKEIQKLYLDFEKKDHDDLSKYLEDLKNENILYISEKPINNNLFPEINFNVSEPNILSNYILTIYRDSDLNSFLSKVLRSITETRTQHVQLRLEKNLPIEDFEKVFQSFNESNIRSISVVIDYSDFIKNNFQEFIDEYKRILNVIIYGYQQEIEILNDEKYESIEFIKSSESDFPLFRSLNRLRFLSMNPNIIKYSEAKKHNLYYYKKVYIESNGKIYNSPFIEEVYGNIFTDSLLEIIKKPNFRKYWNITKDDIEVCCDCEFRYSCVDGRIPKKKKEKYSFEEECQYNPFKTTFNEN